MIYVGIDNGLSGGITVLDKEQNIIKSFIMPTLKVNKKNEYDTKSIVEFFHNPGYALSDIHCCLEKSHVRPVSGKRACFMTGYGYGLMQGILECIGVSYEIVTPQAWMKELGLNSKEGKGSIPFCQRKWPNFDWARTERCKKAHDGKTDSACIALYCYRRNI